MNSLLFWIPILRNDNDNLVLIKLNPEDENYKKICLVSIDINYQIRYYILNEVKDNEVKDIENIIENIILKLKNIIIKYKKKYKKKRNISYTNINVY